jgi:hypothetical protein
MKNVDALEAARGGPFTYLLDGEVLTGPDPAAMHYQIVLLALNDRVMPDCPADMAYWKVEALFERWQAHYDLPDFEQARRLAYVVDHYIDSLTYDLQSHLQVDLGTLWRSRRWNTLLALLDRLPRWSYYYDAISNDPEHADMVAKALADAGPREETPASGPALTTWTPEVEQIVRLIDAVKALHYIIPASQGSKNVKAPPPEERPSTLLDQARKRGEFKRRKAAHDKLAARLLPHKRPSSDDSPR